MRAGRIFESAIWLGHMVLAQDMSISCLLRSVLVIIGLLPFFTNISPVHSVGSPGDMLMKTPWGHASLSPVL